MMEHNINKLGQFNIILIIVGFLISGLLPTFISGLGETFTSAYRGLVLLISVIIILFSFVSNYKRITKGSFVFFGLFWFVYSLRLFYDLFIVEIRLFDQKTIDFYLLNAFGVVLLPCISLFYLNFTKLNFRSILWWTYLLLFLSLSLSLIIKNQSGIESNRSAGDINVGILLYGQYGAMLCLLSIFLFIEKKGYLIRLFFGLGFVIGFLAIFISASRSPILALLFILLVVLLLKFATFKTFLITISTIFVTYVFFEDIFSILNNNFNSSFLLRLQQALDGDTGGRENFIGLGFDDFIENPFLGNAMLLQKQGYIGSYPHNLIVESFMATGFFGGFVFLLWIFKCLKAFFNIIKKNINVSWIAIIFLQFLIFGMFSGNLYSSNLFWFTSVLLVGLTINEFNTSKIA